MKLVITILKIICFLSFIIELNICNNLLLKKKSRKTKAKMSLFEYNKKFLEKQFKSYFYKHASENFKFIGLDTKSLKENNSVNNNVKKIKSRQYINDDILSQGWIKFLEISENSRGAPSSFIKNNMFYLQMSENARIITVAKDIVGYVNIPNEDYFFVELTESQLKIFTGRNPRYKKLKKVLKISDIVAQVSDIPCKGGIEDVGNFEEGYCFMIKFTSYSKLYIWELCADSILEKDTWMRQLLDLNKKNFDNKGDLGNNYNDVSGVTDIHVMRPAIPVHYIAPTGLHPVHMMGIDSYQAPVVAVHSPVNYNGFQVSENWSECSRTCGKGVQTRIWICIDEKICNGKRLEERSCNIQACKEEIENGLSNLKKATEGRWEYLGTWSECTVPCGGGLQTITRKCTSGACMGMQTVVTQSCNIFECLENPNSMENIRNSIAECRAIDGKLFMIENNQMVLSRVVINTNSIMIYPPDHPNYPMSIPLMKVIEVRNSHSRPNCFKVIDSMEKFVYLCPPQETIHNSGILDKY